MRLLLSLLLVGSGAWAQSQSALEADPKGWIDLLPGKDLKGWTRLPVPPTAQLNPVSQWKVDTANRVLICEGDKGHEFLRCDRGEFANFIFHVEWRFTKIEGGKGYNSGVYVRNSADGDIWHQAQVGSASGGFLFADTLVGGEKKRVMLRDRLKEQRVKEAGEWNTYEIRADGKKLSLWVNGAVTSEFDECEVPKGYVGLEAEGYRIEFRNIKLKRLR